MNTVKIGNKFEDKSYNLIIKAIENGELGISGKYAKVYPKRKYYSKDREKDITFDLAIEIWAPNASRYTLLFLIECKSSNSKKVPVDDVEEFYSKIIQVAGVNVKGIMISDNSFQEGSITFAKNKGMMLIEVDKSGNHSIVLHRTDKKTNISDEEDLNELFCKFVKKTLGFKSVQGLQVLSAKQIEYSAQIVLNKFTQENKAIEISKFIKFLHSQYKLNFDLKNDLETVNGKKVLGYYDVKNKKILINHSVVDTKSFRFVLGHEIAHFFLHSNLKINQEIYDDFEDSEYNYLTDRQSLENPKHWIEWQANKFAVSLFLPEELFKLHLSAFRKSIGISRYQYIYLDNQPTNKIDYFRTVEYLSNFFKMSKTSITYRIEEFKLITYANGKDDFRSVLRRTIFE